jgi:DUF1680 family protein
MPSWVDQNLVKVDGYMDSSQINNGYLKIHRPRVNDWIKIKFNLPQRELVLEHACRNIHVRLRGDAVVAMENFGAELTFFNPY